MARTEEFVLLPGDVRALVSLCGVKSRPGLPPLFRLVHIGSETGDIQILPNNPNRLWAIIQNVGLVNLEIQLNTPPSWTQYHLVLTPGSCLLLNEAFPFAGEVRCNTLAVGNSEVHAFEAMVQ